MDIKQLIQSCHLNFLIGSGASAPFLKTLGDIENLLTRLERSDIEDEKKRIIEASIIKKYFDLSISGNLDLIKGTNKGTWETVYNKYQNFIHALNSILIHRKTTLINKRVNLFTTNYDLFLELACEKQKFETNDGFVGRFAPILDLSSYRRVSSTSSAYFDMKSELPQFNIFKLHGSVNWLSEEKNITSDITLSNLSNLQNANLNDDICIDVLDDDGDLKSISNLAKEANEIEFQDEHDNYLNKYSEIQIINPNKEKFKHTTLNYLYYELLRIYSNELEKQNAVLFVIGFSFADEHIREITLRALNSNPTLKVVVLSYDSKSERETRKYFEASKQNFKYDNLEFVERNNDGSKTEEKLDLSIINEKYFQKLASQLSKNLSGH